MAWNPEATDVIRQADLILDNANQLQVIDWTEQARCDLVASRNEFWQTVIRHYSRLNIAVPGSEPAVGPRGVDDVAAEPKPIYRFQYFAGDGIQPFLRTSFYHEGLNAEGLFINPTHANHKLPVQRIITSQRPFTTILTHPKSELARIYEDQCRVIRAFPKLDRHDAIRLSLRSVPDVKAR